MNEEICCIVNKGKTVKIGWVNVDYGFLQALCSLYKKLGQLFLHTLFTNFFKQRYRDTFKYFNNLISEV